QHPPDHLEVPTQGIADQEISRFWFVVHQVDDGRNVAMLAEEVDQHEWEGFWTFDSDEVRAIDQYIAQTF
ncbi:MAG: hypothetical protein ABEI86_09020, partial [Halobacteriaceae archaeon]